LNLNQARVVLRPRSVQEIGDLTLRFVGAHWGLFLRLLSPFLGVCWAGTWALRRAFGGGWLAPWFLAVVVSYVSLGYFTLVASELLFQSPARVRRARLGRRALRVLPKRLILDVWRWLQIFLGSLVVVLIPRMTATTLYAPEALLLEGAPLAGAHRRAAALARFHHGRCFGLFLGSILLAGLVMLMAEMLGRSILEDVLQLGRPLGELSDGGSYFAFTGLLLACPYVACLRFLGYIDLRTRKEGWDIQLRFKAWREEQTEVGEPPDRIAQQEAADARPRDRLPARHLAGQDVGQDSRDATPLPVAKVLR